MGIDIMTAGVGLLSFGIFLVIHVIVFRRVAPEHLLRSLVTCLIAVMGLPVFLMGVLYILKAMDATPQAWICAAVLAALVQGLLCFAYVLCVFGPYETSIRMRLVREIARGGAEGVFLQELLGRYNPETIVDARLQRLLGSGDIIKKDGLYRAGHRRNFFFIFNGIAGVIKKWTG